MAGYPAGADPVRRGVLADAGREKLTALVLGADQERALRAAATAAVQRTAAERRELHQLAIIACGLGGR
jgi:hypothetical protein